jgi:hypothetical protein
MQSVPAVRICSVVWLGNTQSRSPVQATVHTFSRLTVLVTSAYCVPPCWFERVPVAWLQESNLTYHYSILLLIGAHIYGRPFSDDVAAKP